MEGETLRELYVEEIKDLWSAENQILKALPRMIKPATHPSLHARLREPGRVAPDNSR